MKAPRDGWDADEIDALNGIQPDFESLITHHQNDPPAALLRAAQHDALPPELQDDARTYLSNHAWSRALVEGLDSENTSLSPADQDRLFARIQKATAHARESESRASWWRWPLLAASAVAVLLLGVTIWRGASVTPSAPTSTTASSETTPAQAPPSGPAAQPQVRETRLPLEPPELMLTAVTLNWRGPGVGNQLMSDMKPAMDAFRGNDYATADREFGALELRYPNAVEVFFYGGVARLFVNEPERAAAALAHAAGIADDVFAPRVAWYRAIAELRAGRPAEARRLLQPLCRGGGQYGTQACDAVRQIDGASKTAR